MKQAFKFFLWLTIAGFIVAALDFVIEGLVMNQDAGGPIFAIGMFALGGGALLSLLSGLACIAAGKW